MKFKKKAFTVVISLMLIATSCISLVYADELADINKEKAEVKGDLQQLYKSIKNQQKDIKEYEASIVKKQGDINRTALEVQEKEREIKETTEALNKRLRGMYKNGSVGYIDILLGSGSLSEFLNNVELIRRIYKSDQQTITSLKTEQAALKQKVSALETEKTKLADSKAKAEKKKTALDADKKELEKKYDELTAEANRIGRELAAKQDANKVYGGGQFLWPTTGRKINSYFGYRVHPIFGYKKLHTGLDIGGVGVGSPVFAAADGKVIYAGYTQGYGNLVVIDHGSGLSTYYAHNSSLKVSVGQSVSRGNVIAATGSTGNSTGPHLHFEVRVNGVYKNPLNYL